jgi:hypothetical protein
MITIVLPISRLTYLKAVFDSLDTLERLNNTELLIITDGNRDLEQSVDRRLDSINYSHVRVISFGDTPKPDHYNDRKIVAERRSHIAAIHNFAKHHIAEECDFVFSIEDDTTYPPDTLSKLLNSMDEQPNAAFVQGIELGRHSTPYAGGWLADNVYNPNTIQSIMPQDGLQEIDAGGLYCALIDAELYRMHQFEPLDKDGDNGLSCDVNFGLYLVQQGYTCWADWSIQCDHIGEKGAVNLGNTEPCKVIFEKHKNKWGSWVA